MSTAVVPTPDLATLSPEAITALKSQLRPAVEDEVRSQMRTAFDIELAKTRDEMTRQNEQIVREAVTKWQEEDAKRREPLTPTQIQLMLDKEYATFKLKLAKGDEFVEFTLHELSQFHEKKFFAIAKTTLTNAVAELGGAQVKLVEGDVFQTITSMMEVFEPVFDVMAECCVICLNANGSLDWLTKQWVTANMSSYRIMTVVQAQVELNRLRDFFSYLFQGFQTTANVSQAAVQR